MLDKIKEVLDQGYSVEVWLETIGPDTGKYAAKVELMADPYKNWATAKAATISDAILLAHRDATGQDVVTQCREFAGYGMAYQLWDRHNTVSAREVLLRAAEEIEKLRKTQCGPNQAATR